MPVLAYQITIRQFVQGLGKPVKQNIVLLHSFVETDPHKIVDELSEKTEFNMAYYRITSSTNQESQESLYTSQN